VGAGAGSRTKDDDYVDKLLTTTRTRTCCCLEPRQVYRPPCARDPHEGPQPRAAPRSSTSSTLAQDERIEAIIDTRTYEKARFWCFGDQERDGQEDPHDRYDTSHGAAHRINLVANDELVRSSRRPVATTS